MFLIFASLANMEESVSVEPDTILQLKFPDPINEYTGSDPTDPFAGLFDKKMGLDEIIHAIKVASDDKNIRGISINTTFINAGISQTKAIRDALKDFKDSGKFVYAYSDYFQQKDYYLASVADSLFLNPAGAVEFRGLSAEVLFFKDLQDKSGVRMEVVRHGKYKSAVEPFISDSMSDSNREQIQALIGSLWATISADIADDRGMGTEALNQVADTLGGRTPEYALKSGLIDGIVYDDQYRERLRAATGRGTDQDQEFIDLEDYIKLAGNKGLPKGADKIAVIYAQGEIFYGEGGQNIIGQGIVNKALIKARKDDDVKAIVLRINSPGGSSLTSELIWREVARAGEEKPLVVSMSDMCASGGYYMAAAADKIMAEPTTITGSIGVLMVIPNIHEFAGKVGINAEQVGTNENSVEYSLFEPMSAQFRKVATEGIEHTYNTFLKRVADGRNLTVAEVDSIAQGRVWSGTDAIENGLVDSIGGLDDAISEAASLAGITEYGIRKYPRYKSGFARLMDDLGETSTKQKEVVLESELGAELYGIYRELKGTFSQEGIQARLPFVLNIK
jgi:protease-4